MDLICDLFYHKCFYLVIFVLFSETEKTGLGVGESDEEETDGSDDGEDETDDSDESKQEVALQRFHLISKLLAAFL